MSEDKTGIPKFMASRRIQTACRRLNPGRISKINFCHTLLNRFFEVKVKLLLEKCAKKIYTKVMIIWEKKDLS